MINIKDKSQCCGCGACAQKCPRGCIMMSDDEEGFKYPIIDSTLCIKCGLCDKVCPILNNFSIINPQKVYAAYNINEEQRLHSSSGALFPLLAEETINEGGVVFGAAFDDNWNVILDYTEDKIGIDRFRGSKYVQANVRETFKLCEDFLKSGRNVLFSGTPCQIAGLKLYLNKEYEKLITIDVVCHGVPSPMIWHEYLLASVENTFNLKRQSMEKVPVCPASNYMSLIKGINFRDKSDGWKKYRFVLETVENKSNTVIPSYIINEYHRENIFMKAFLSDLILRPSCYTCPFRGINHRQSDISIADFWGIQKVFPEIDDDKGVSLVFINSEKGISAISIPKLVIKQIELDNISFLNGGLRNSIDINPRRKFFFKSIKNVGVIKALSLYTLEAQQYKLETAPLWKRPLIKMQNRASIFFVHIKRLIKKTIILLQHP